MKDQILNLIVEYYSKAVFAEDDCAPDAQHEFEKKLQNLLEISLRDFKESCDMCITCEDTLMWVNGSYLLMLVAEDPYHKLYRKPTWSDKAAEAIKLCVENLKKLQSAS